MPRYYFSGFVLSPRQRVLVHDGRELPLIPRYFDLLVFLVEHRREAVHRRGIFDRVWSDVVVSDSALSQAIRTIRRALGVDSREPRFIRTVSRHGYRFVFADVIEAPDDEEPPAVAVAVPSPPARSEAPASAAGCRSRSAAAWKVSSLAPPPEPGTPLRLVRRKAAWLRREAAVGCTPPPSPLPAVRRAHCSSHSRADHSSVEPSTPSHARRRAHRPSHAARPTDR